MIPISTSSFVKKYIANNPSENAKVISKNLEANLKRKKIDARCKQCGEPIWVIGTSICGWDGCFPCITGEADASRDYEVK
ncbi:hypothetical protein [Ammoniphilus sp. YIM 78166]|uniref:hypothetical protein n=1 Tax=Ammoniphilus sp. YIM 78166 TaxID=1644106 RepID=UPI00196B7009|nr:hypothetical protein [Ammoniphilus sp. YIM 78166]